MLHHLIRHLLGERRPFLLAHALVRYVVHQPAASLGLLLTLAEQPWRGLPLTADVWLAYGVGAVVGGAAELLWRPAAPLPAVAAVAAVVVLMAARRPEP